jgi:hypothetical protein
MLHWIKSNDGKEFPVALSQAVIVRLASAEKIPHSKALSMLNDFDKWPMDRLFRMYYFMFRTGAVKANREFTISEDEFIDWIDERPELLEQIMTSFTESLPQDTKKKKGGQ